MPSLSAEPLPPFADLPPAFSAFERSRVFLLPVPYEQTTTYLKGTAGGPAAILRASTQVELYDEVLEAEPFRVGIHTLPPLDVSGPPETLVERLADCVRALPADRLPVVLGGEHTVTVGAARALNQRHSGLGFLVLDAHDDLRDEYEGSSLNHACVSRRLSELGPVVQVGIRSVSPDGRRLARFQHDAGFSPSPSQGEGRGEGSGHSLSHPVLTVTADHVHHRGMPTETILAALPERIYLSVDVDAFDPAYCPGVGTPEPGGLDWYQVTDLAAAVAKARRIIGFDVVEVRPLADQAATEFLAAKLIYRIIGLIARAAGWPALA
jgi:agmatinase